MAWTCLYLSQNSWRPGRFRKCGTRDKVFRVLHKPGDNMNRGWNLLATPQGVSQLVTAIVKFHDCFCSLAIILPHRQAKPSPNRSPRDTGHQHISIRPRLVARSGPPVLGSGRKTVACRPPISGGAGAGWRDFALDLALLGAEPSVLVSGDAM